MTVSPNDLSFEADIARAATLPSRWYTEAEPLRLEKETVFARSWQLAGALAQVAKPGDYFTCEVGGEPIVVVRTPDAVKAFYNVCRHRGGPVAQGEHGNVKMFRCGYHGWLYGLGGELKTTPEFKGVACFDKADFGLKAVQTGVFGPFVFVKLEAGGVGLGDYLGKIPAETARFPLASMGFYKRVSWELKCNWKVYVDNYLEGYHIPLVHPGLMKELDYPQYKVEVERFHSKQHAPVRNREGSLYRRNLEPGTPAEALYYWVFPNLMLNFYPDNIQINTIVPLSHDRTLTVFDWYLADAEAPGVAADFAKSLSFSESVQQEDISICEQVQKGLASRSYDRGRYSVDRETGVHHFHGLYCEFLKGR